MGFGEFSSDAILTSGLVGVLVDDLVSALGRRSLDLTADESVCLTEASDFGTEWLLVPVVDDGGLTDELASLTGVVGVVVFLVGVVTIALTVKDDEEEEEDEDEEEEEEVDEGDED